MIDVMKLRDWLQNFCSGYPVSYVQFPENPDRVAGFTIEEGEESKGTVSDLRLNVFFRAEHPEPAIIAANELSKQLNMMTKVFIENTQIILIKANDTVPVPSGIDENKRHVFTVQFKMLVTLTDKLNVKE